MSRQFLSTHVAGSSRARAVSGGCCSAHLMSVTVIDSEHRGERLADLHRPPHVARAGMPTKTTRKDLSGMMGRRLTVIAMVVTDRSMDAARRRAHEQVATSTSSIYRHVHIQHLRAVRKLQRPIAGWWCIRKVQFKHNVTVLHYA